MEVRDCLEKKKDEYGITLEMEKFGSALFLSKTIIDEDYENMSANIIYKQLRDVFYYSYCDFDNMINEEYKNTITSVEFIINYVQTKEMLAWLEETLECKGKYFVYKDISPNMEFHFLKNENEFTIFEVKDGMIMSNFKAIDSSTQYLRKITSYNVEYSDTINIPKKLLDAMK